jgi:predicted nuclease of predicted toxin-antitoxin system
MDDAIDYEIWSFCSDGDFIMVSKDADFLHLANRIGNCRNQALLTAFQTALADIRTAFDTGGRIVELR